MSPCPPGAPTDSQAPRVLFICTGNYYRSRFAEALFNHHACGRNLAWRAVSRGLAIHLVTGDLSPFAAQALEQRAVELRHTAPIRIPLCEADLREARLRIALREREHRPLLARAFPDWEPHVRFWDVADADELAPDDALRRIEEQVLALLDELAGGPAAG
jgi:protein-tyrosine phosphatase